MLIFKNKKQRMYSFSNFLEEANFTTEPTVLKLKDNNGNVSFLLSSCHSQKTALKNNTVVIVSNNFTEPKVLEFPTNAEAANAFSLLTAKLYEYRKNCKTGGGGGGGGNDYTGPKTIQLNIGGEVWSDPYTIPSSYDLTNNKIDMYVNGQKLIRNIDYTVDFANRLISIIANPANLVCGKQICILSTDRIEIVIY